MGCVGCVGHGKRKVASGHDKGKGEGAQKLALKPGEGDGGLRRIKKCLCMMFMQVGEVMG